MGQQAKKGLDRKTIIRLIAGVVSIIIAYFIAEATPPAGLTTASMRFMGIFFCLVVFMMFEVIPDFAVALTFCPLMVIFGVAKKELAFAQFAGDTFLLIIAAMGIGAAIAKSGLLNRVTLMIFKCFPGTYKGQVLAFLVSGTIISPFIPSNTAKLAIAAPFGKAVSDKLGYTKESQGAAGIFSAIWISFGNAAQMFLSASVWCYIILGILPKGYAANFTWTNWFLAAWPWGLVVLVGSYFGLTMLYKPKDGVELPPGFARDALKQLGPMNKNEKIVLVTILLAVCFWVTERLHGFPAHTIAWLAFAIMFTFKTIDVSDVRNKISWETVTLIATILSIAGLFNPLGISKWTASIVAPFFAPFIGNLYLFLIVVAVVIYVVRFAIISTMAVFVVFSLLLMPMAINAGYNPWIIPFAVFASVQVWNTYYQNTIYIGILAASGDMCLHKNTIKASVMYMVLSILGLLVSIPVWQMLGLVK